MNCPKRISAILAILACLASSAAGAERGAAWRTVRRFHPPEIPAEMLPEGVRAEGASLRVDADGLTGGEATLLELSDPPQTGVRYRIVGRIRCTDVRPAGYLELLSRFGDEQYFTRTLAESGPMRKLLGDREWSRFALPFDPRGRAPDALHLRIVLPGRGEVALDSLEIQTLRLAAAVQTPGESPLGGGGEAWWTDRVGGYIGGVGGVVIGLFSALFALLVVRGRARKQVVSAMGLLSLAGLASLGAGVAAVLRDQPYGVWYPLVLLGALGVALFGGGAFLAIRRYRQAELRRVQAMDVGTETK